MALDELDRVRALGVRFGEVVADAGYGPSAAFRRGLSERGLSWAVGITCIQTVYKTTVEVSAKLRLVRDLAENQDRSPAQARDRQRDACSG
jgi:SRSO17 transposase